MTEDERIQRIREIADKMEEMGKDLINSGVQYGFSIRQQAVNLRKVIE